MDVSKKYGWLKPGVVVGSYEIISTQNAKQLKDKILVKVIQEGLNKTGLVKELSISYLMHYPQLKQKPAKPYYYVKKEKVKIDKDPKSMITNQTILPGSKLVEWKLENNYVVGKCSNSGLIFYLDYEDYDKVKNMHFGSHNYFGGRPYVCYRYVDNDGKQHNCSLLNILGFPYWTRFKNGNHMDFRKENIETTNRTRCNIKNGVTGISYDYKHNVWKSKLRLKPMKEDEHWKEVGICESKDLGECIKVRLESEKEYLDNYYEKSPQWKKELFNVWGI